MDKRNVPFSPPDYTEAEVEAVVEVIRSGWITTGPKTKEFERVIADYCKTKKAVAMNSATAAMEMTLRLLGVGPGDEVITSAYTYSASASVITHVGAKIVMVDTGKNSFHIDYDAIEDAITENTKAIIPVDIAGVMCDYDKLFKAVRRKKHIFRCDNDVQQALGRVVLLADAAHSIGATYKNRMSGEVADFTCFSFHAVKNLTTAEGGMVTWKSINGIDDEDIYKRFMLLSLHGQSKDALAKTELGSWEYDIVAPNYKCNMTDIMSALGLAQFRRYKEILKRRKDIVERYNRLLKNFNVESLNHFNKDNHSSAHLYLLRILDKDENYRNKLINLLAQKGVSSNVHYKPLPMHTAYKNLGFEIENYPNAYDMYKNEITLPLHTLLSDDDVDYVVNILSDAIRKLE